MKYLMSENLVLELIPETPEDQALVKLLDGMRVSKGGTIRNVGMTADQGHRTTVTIHFLPNSNQS